MSLNDTKQNIITGALYSLGLPPLYDVNHPRSPVEAQCLNIYQSVLNAELRKYVWVFAIKNTAFLDQVQDPTATKYYWPLPTDCMRPILDNLDDPTMAKTFYVEGSNIVSTSYKAPNIRYISNAVTESEFDVLFAQALKYRLGIELCEFATQSSQKKSDLNNLYQTTITDAAQQNAFEQPQQTYYSPQSKYSWLTARSNFYINYYNY